MNPAAPHLRDLAERLLAVECDSGNGAYEPAAQRVCGKLGSVISKVAGAAGYRSVLSRALAMAQAEVPDLGSVRVSSNGVLEGFAGTNTRANNEEFAHGEVALVAQLLSLLHTFIGEPLTQQLVKEAWPAIDPRSSSDSPTP